ncbi:MAG: AbiV family abortive infection protein [Devosia sp.]|nr:AbiV family abortive infection protein [Devosia sp.]
MSSEDATENVSEAILANCRRLIADAMLLLERGSAGSALALAIMALEEVGKGHQLELETTKGKSTPSWHHYRQFLASFVLMVSLFQKYGLPRPQFPDGIQQRIRERWAGKKGLRDIVGVPIPEDLRADVGGWIEPLLLKMDPDDLIIFRIELRWVNKVMMAAASGNLEALRQSGLYLDHSDGIVGSDPANVVRQDAYRWIRVAERALLLLESGDFLAPYGELAGFLEARRPLPKGEELARLLEGLRVQPE